MPPPGIYDISFLIDDSSEGGGASPSILPLLILLRVLERGADEDEAIA
jgi:hypothetical protein